MHELKRREHELVSLLKEIKSQRVKLMRERSKYPNELEQLFTLKQQYQFELKEVRSKMKGIDKSGRKVTTVKFMPEVKEMADLRAFDIFGNTKSLSDYLTVLIESDFKKHNK
jgi:predicted  nucleic acid-binding Zn-ribbon protein